MRPVLLVCFILIYRTMVIGQDAVIPDEIKPFLLKGYEILSLDTADLNNDKLRDAILVIRNPAEDSSYDERMIRPLLLLIRQKDGKLKQVVRNNDAIMGRHDGGMMGDPWAGMSVLKNGFGLAFYGGSSWRWAYYYEFRWNKLKKNWFLMKEESSHFNSGDMEGTMRSTEIDASELGEIGIDRFRPDLGYEESKWKVIAMKTFFYDNPAAGSKPRKGYLVKGNTCTASRQLKNFVLVDFDNGKGEITSGYILKKDLVRLK
jgi:hypothetical protein